jgi:hypothetical protein
MGRCRHCTCTFSCAHVTCQHLCIHIFERAFGSSPLSCAQMLTLGTSKAKSMALQRKKPAKLKWTQGHLSRYLCYALTFQFCGKCGAGCTRRARSRRFLADALAALRNSKGLSSARRSRKYVAYVFNTFRVHICMRVRIYAGTPHILCTVCVRARAVQECVLQGICTRVFFHLCELNSEPKYRDNVLLCSQISKRRAKVPRTAAQKEAAAKCVPNANDIYMPTLTRT